MHNISNLRFGNLIALRVRGPHPSGHLIWTCKCDCGADCEILGTVLCSGRQRSCGCINLAYKHGHARKGKISPEFNAFTNAKARCTNPNNPGFSGYGGRGILFKFSSFTEFMKDVGPRPQNGLSIDRIDNDGHYEPGNLRWATGTEQQHNKRRYKRRARA